MEFGVSESENNIDIIWNGPLEKLCRKLIICSTSKTHHMKIYLFFPKMPANHVISLAERLRRCWFSTVGRSTTGATKALNGLKENIKEEGLITDDAVLIKVLEKIELDDVATDLDLVAIKSWQTHSRMNSIWAFCFAPDDLQHFLENVKISTDQICYGRNGDTSLN